MNVQAAIQAGIAIKFVADNWLTSDPVKGLTGQTITLSTGSYLVLATIYANDLATDRFPPRYEFKAVGVVAQNTANASDVYIAIRGTADPAEWLQDFKFLQQPFPNVPGAGLTEDGFTDVYLSFSLTPSPSASGRFVKDLATLALPANATITVAGHSLGAALATLLALDLAGNSNLAIVLYTLASPRVGDLNFEHLFNHIVPRAYRIHNRLDIVTKTPPPFFYYHVGDETELVPNDIKFDLACEHHLTSYLHMLAQLIGQPGFDLDPDCRS